MIEKRVFFWDGNFFFNLDSMEPVPSAYFTASLLYLTRFTVNSYYAWYQQKAEFYYLHSFPGTQRGGSKHGLHKTSMYRTFTWRNSNTSPEICLYKVCPSVRPFVDPSIHPYVCPSNKETMDALSDFLSTFCSEFFYSTVLYLFFCHYVFMVNIFIYGFSLIKDKKHSRWVFLPSWK